MRWCGGCWRPIPRGGTARRRRSPRCCAGSARAAQRRDRPRARSRWSAWPTRRRRAAVGLAVVACKGLEIRWRRSGLAVAAPDRPVAQARVVLWLGAFAVALYATRRTFEAFGYIGIFRYMPIFGGLVEVAVVWFTWS